MSRGIATIGMRPAMGALFGRCLSMQNESLGAPEPEFEDASLGAGRGSGPEMVDWGMYGEDRWVTACEREETRAVVPVHVNGLRLP